MHQHCELWLQMAYFPYLIISLCNESHCSFQKLEGSFSKKDVAAFLVIIRAAFRIPVFISETLWLGKWTQKTGFYTATHLPCIHYLSWLEMTPAASTGTGRGQSSHSETQGRGSDGEESNFWLAGRNRTALQTEQQPRYTSCPLQRPEIQNPVAEPGRGTQTAVPLSPEA